MSVVREPLLHPVSISSLKPTQITVGFREVEEKQRHWRAQAEGKKSRFLGQHMIPVIFGPKDRYYVVDHHHLARALQREGVKDILVEVVKDLRMLKGDAFWAFLDHHGWVYPFDAQGRRCSYSKIPRGISKLVDDPYRSLAGELRRAGGFAKDTTPFSEFLWADFLRVRIKRKIIAMDFEAAAERALTLAKSAEASFLPGWCGRLRGKHAGNRLDATRTDALLPRSETGKINRVHRPCYGRLSPGALECSNAWRTGWFQALLSFGRSGCQGKRPSTSN